MLVLALCLVKGFVAPPAPKMPKFDVTTDAEYVTNFVKVDIGL